MSDVAFYHLTRAPLAVALPKLMDRVLAAGMRAVVWVPDTATAKAVDEALWTADPDSFIPHGTKATGHAADQPIYISTEGDNPNAATVLVVVNGAAATPEAMAPFDRTLVMFDGNDDAELATARDRWKAGKDAGHTLTYWQQGDTGGWQKKDI